MRAPGGKIVRIDNETVLGLLLRGEGAINPDDES